jgi:glycosyltransferase involved in cell wall biosynthesis
MTMATHPLVSVLMTAYNRERYITLAIESVLAQTFTDFELIVVDDCSNDETVDIAKRYAADSRVHIHVNQQNIGDYPNRNRAAALAHGKYLKYVDSDDTIYPHGLAVMVEMMGRFPDAGMGFASLPQDLHRPFPFQLSPREVFLRHYLNGFVFDKAPLSTIILNDAFHSVGGFSGKRYVGDFELWHLIAARYPVVLMPEGLVWSREHEEQESTYNQTDFMALLEHELISSRELGKPDCPLTPSERAEFLRKVRRRQARMVLGQIRRRCYRLARQMFLRANLSVLDLLSAVRR